MIVLPTPLGPFWCASTPEGRPVCGWSALESPGAGLEAPPMEWDLQRRLEAWFEDPAIRGVERFLDLPLPEGTPFETGCRAILRNSQVGDTLPYGALAVEAGRPGAARAVGRAMRRNPAPILVPCHRVVSASGGVGGYGGVFDATHSRTHPAIRIKRGLLALEADAIPPERSRLCPGTATSLQSPARSRR